MHRGNSESSSFSILNQSEMRLTDRRLFLVGHSGVSHLGHYLLHGAQELGMGVDFCDTHLAYKGAWWLTKLNWWLLGHRPLRLRSFGLRVVEACRQFKPSFLLATGLAPLEREALRMIGKMGIRRLNYLTDDPWNPAHRTRWFIKALPDYDHVFSVRRVNLEDLRQTGCARVSYLPFAYTPELHYPEDPATVAEQKKFESDVVFIGGADRDRLSLMGALIEAGFKAGLYGNYWDRYPKTRPYYQGIADPRTLRLAIRGTKVALCLVRRANRDGNSMRTFEIPAIGACMLTEETEEHREIFGKEGEAVVYFRSISEMIDKLSWLLAHPEERERLAEAAHHQIIKGRNTYRDRLEFMLNSGRSQGHHEADG